jgi:integrase/recombinase XerD
VVVDNHGELVEPAARYLKYLDLCGKARNTLRTYARSLAFYFTFLRQKGLAYERVQIADLAAFVHWLKRTDWPTGANVPTRIRSNRTINLHLGVVSGFYEYAWRTDQIDHDLNERLRGQVPGGYRPYKAFLHHLDTTPIEGNVLKQPTDRRRGPQTLTTTQIERVIETCKTPRDRLIVHMLFETGLRPGELLALWLEDVKISPPQVQVVDRGELVNDAESALRRYVRSTSRGTWLTVSSTTPAWHIRKRSKPIICCSSSTVSTRVCRWITEICTRCSRDCSAARESSSRHTRCAIRR